MNHQENIESYCNYLRLAYVRDHYPAEIENAIKTKSSYQDFLHTILRGQVLQRIENSINRSLKTAGFTAIKTLESFDFSFQPQLDEKRIRELGSLQFIHHKENVIFLGPPGVGKTHLAISLGVKACQARMRVAFYSINQLMSDLAIAQMTGKLVTFMQKLTKLDLLIMDELGYMELSNDQAKWIFQLISRRYETGAVIITSNKQPDQWGKVFNDDVIATAILDRVFHHCHPFVIMGDSYRLKNVYIAKNEE